MKCATTNTASTVTPWPRSSPEATAGGLRRRLGAALLALALAPAPCAAVAQGDEAAQSRAAQAAPDLAFPTEPSPPDFSGRPAMALYRPAGAGPFPALVLAHQCGGLGGARWSNGSMLDWAKRAYERGYVVLLVDSLGPRGATSVCLGPQQNIFFSRGAKDLLQAAAHLRSLPYVDPKRVAAAGFSWGAMAGLFASSRSLANALVPGERPAAVVSFYPGCFTLRPGTLQAYELVRGDIDRPLLVMMGGEDTETPPGECVDKLGPARAAGAPVETHVFPTATHCWDCRTLDGLRKRDFRGTDVVYRYDPAVTEDSARRMFDFLDRHLPRS